MTDSGPLELIGYHNPTGTLPAFLVAVFASGPQANTFYAQILASDGRVEQFVTTSLRRDELMPVRPDRIEQRVRDEGWWAFALAGDEIIAGRADAVRVRLRAQLDDPRLAGNDFVMLEVAPFVDDPGREEEALRRIYQRMRAEQPEEAEFWRDVSILLPPIKKGLRGLPPDADILETFPRLVDDATIRVEGDTPLLLMREPLLAFCQRWKARFRMAMAEADRLARALDLKPVEAAGRGDRTAAVAEPARQEASPAFSSGFSGGFAAASPTRRKSLLADLKRQLKLLEDDIRVRNTVPDVLAVKDFLDLPDVNGDGGRLKPDWDAARSAGRTALPFAEWREAEITQAAVHWLLSCVFVRFCEDNGLIATPLLAGPSTGRLEAARWQHDEFFRRNPRLSDRDYLINAFETVERQPGMSPLFDRRHNPVWRLQPSGDGAAALLAFFQRIEPATGALIHDFTAPGLDTRFLGDLYQDLSEAARDRYALLQTPDFVEAFILDRTLEPAIAEFGLAEVRMIDPTCGSGHFLLGAFHRLLGHWRREQPTAPVRELVQRALDAVHGVDLNPFAVAIARFRLMVAALEACGIARLADAPTFRTNLACGDSLLHGRHFGKMAFQLDDGSEAKVLRHVYQSEDAEDLARILGQQYHAVVGNPPYITVKDKALNEAYRSLFTSCHMKYALSVPFIERFFDLGFDGRRQTWETLMWQELGRPTAFSGYLGLIVANSFMKREFGSKLIEQVLPTLDLTDIIDTAGAYIPGHGTPTCILFGRNRAPVGETLKAVLGIKGEPGKPADPARGLVWRAIVNQIDAPGSESAFITVSTPKRSVFAKHPWSIGGGGAVELKEHMEKIAKKTLVSVVNEIGFASFSGADEAFVSDAASLNRRLVPKKFQKPLVTGELVLDWIEFSGDWAIAPYDHELSLVDITELGQLSLIQWPLRRTLKSTMSFGGQTKQDLGMPWWGWYRWISQRLLCPRLISFAFVATHNHFVCHRELKAFQRTAPIIQLPESASEDFRVSLVATLNSSAACYWMKQVFQNRGSTVDERGARQRTSPFEDFYEFTGTGLKSFPLPNSYPLDLAREIDNLAHEFSIRLPDAVVAQGTPTLGRLHDAKKQATQVRKAMIAWQEESDWRYYHLYGVLKEPVEYRYPPDLRINLGERAFEIVMARQMARGELQTSWFERHRSKPITELPEHWPEEYKKVVEERIRLIETDRFINLLERPEYKRRWAMEPWEELEKKALKGWLLDRLELPRYWEHGELITTARLADLALDDPDFLQVAELYEGTSAVDVPTLVATLVRGEAVPFLPVLRYADTGLRKRAQWEETWALQRREDAGETIAEIPVPPKYRSADFLDSVFWRLRGPLDVAKERFIAYPGLSRDTDGSLTIAWAGWDHLHQARALAAHLIQLKEQAGWTADRLTPLLAGLLDLVPWLKQWHNDLDPTYGTRMGDYFQDFVAAEAREAGLTLDTVRAWTPAATTKRGRRKGGG